MRDVSDIFAPGQSGRVCALSRGARQMATAIDEDEVCVRWGRARVVAHGLMGVSADPESDGGGAWR